MFLLLLLKVEAPTIPSKVQVSKNCSEFYQPCACFLEVGGTNIPRYNSIRCENVSLATVSEIFHHITANSSSNLFNVHINLSWADANETIPKNLLGHHQARNLISLLGLYGPNNSRSLLSIDPEAFYSSRNFTKMLSIKNFDLNRLNFNFLTGFHRLEILNFNETSNINLANWTFLPPLINLQELRIFNSTGLNEWTSFPNLTKGLNGLILLDNNIRDKPMERILNWTERFSLSTLRGLNIGGNLVTKIPRQISSFSKLETVFFNGQKKGISLIPKGSLNLSAPVFKFSAQGDGITKIESGAFQGIIFFLYKLIFFKTSIFLFLSLISNFKR